MDLSQKSALVIGAGGLGGPALLTLAAGGVGRLVIIDDDVVETSNLNRQPLFAEADLGQPKAVVAAARLQELHPTLQATALTRRFDADQAVELASGVDLLLDGSDNFATKFLASDAALQAGKPLVHGGVLRTSLQILSVVPKFSGCVRCLFEAPPPPGQIPSCAEAGIVGALSGFAGGLMGAEALRLLAGERGTYAGRMLVFEARTGRGRLVLVRRRPGCPACAGTQALEPTGPITCASPAGAAT